MSWQDIPRLLGDGALYGGEVYTVSNDKTNRGYAFIFVHLEPTGADNRRLRPVLPENFPQPLRVTR